ncbi:hypothetical protein [Frigoribacterium sp. Leaf172]|uniref:MmyB family transcriptional regulator n=1 Tax=Frigoribacterium sp. Leaf172 TaxID=1736285 RepID=UPI002101240E|nr:hypothetical protein [Frigoribacterium sp. Leaf172]
MRCSSCCGCRDQPGPRRHGSAESHPELGPIQVDCQALFTEDQSQTLLVLTPTPGSPDAESLRLLGVVGTQRFAD